MKRFTLEWWMELYRKAVNEERYCLVHFNRTANSGMRGVSRKLRDRGDELLELSAWIHTRIIKKYGEK